jgi:hypothetical protein
MAHRITQKKSNPVRESALEAQHEAAVASAAARRLVAEPDLDPHFPAAALLCQDAAAAASRAARRDLNRLVRRA